MVIIGLDQSLSNSSLYEHGCLENIKKLYKSTVKYDDQQQYKAILEEEIVSTPEWFTDNIPMAPGPYVTIKNPSSSKSLRQFFEVLDTKQNTAVHRLGADKSKRKTIIPGSMLCPSIPNRQWHKNINERI